jgi:hypothetical protein
MDILCRICFGSLFNGREGSSGKEEMFPVISESVLPLSNPTLPLNTEGLLTVLSNAERLPPKSQDNGIKDEKGMEIRVETGSTQVESPLDEADTVDEVKEQMNTALSYNALRLIHKLSQNSDYLSVLFDNTSLLSILKRMVTVCLSQNDGCNRKHILHTSLLLYSPYSLHQRATLTMENNYRASHQLNLLCDITIRYCRLYNPDEISSILKISPQNFELMSFSLLPVLIMKHSILDFTFLLNFFKSEIPVLCSTSTAKRQILWRVLKMVAGNLPGCYDDDV